MHCGCKWHMASLFGAAERSLKAESPRIGVHEWQKGETVCLYCGVLCWAGLAGSCLVTLSVHHLPQGQAPDGSYHTTAHWHGTRCSAAAVSQFFIHWLLRAVFFSFLQLSISMQISDPEPINLQTFQQSLYCCSPVSCAFTQMQLFNVSSSFFHSNDSTPTSALPEEENIFRLFLFYVDRGSRVSGFTGFLLLVIQLPNA